MSTKEYPLDYIQALHLLTGEEPVDLEASSGGLVKRRGPLFICPYPGGESIYYIEAFVKHFRSYNFRIYEPPAPEKLEPVELCEELKSHYGSAERCYGLIIAQAVREAVKIAREEREAEKKK